MIKAWSTELWEREKSVLATVVGRLD